MKLILSLVLSLSGGLLGAYLFVQSDQLFGATIARTTQTNPWTFASTTKTNASGTELVRTNVGFCNIRSSATTISASSTQQVECQAGTATQVALTGVTAGDKVFVLPATTTPTTFGGLRIMGASASSTAGSITVQIFNATGASFTWTALSTTSLQYWVVK